MEKQREPVRIWARGNQKISKIRREIGKENSVEGARNKSETREI